jgi:hypothetical protein
MPKMPLKAFAYLAVAPFTFSPLVAAGVTGPAICEREMIRAAELHAVPVSILYAVGLNESGRKGQMTPYALNVAGKSVFPDSKEQGLQMVAAYRAKGVKLIDVGCMQINIHYHAQKFSSIERMFDARTNVEYAAKFIQILRKSTGSWTAAVARYHAGPNNHAAQKRYVCSVIRQMVAAGLGEWTPAARIACTS